MVDSFASRGTLEVGGRRYALARLDALESQGWSLSRLPYCTRILLENLLRREDGIIVTAEDIEAVATWDPEATPTQEIAFMPARVLLQDFTGVPAIVDLAAMRDAMRVMGGDPQKINPLQPAELVIDHSVQVDEYGKAAAFLINAEKEFERNRERYAFLRWGQTAFENFKVVPPDTGIVHQVNLEYLGRVVMTSGDGAEPMAFPDTLVGTDSHTTMINGLGILGWGVGGIEAEAVMLGQPVSMLVPQVVGFRLIGRLREGATATDMVLRVTELLRAHGVVGKFVEFFGEGLAGLRLADRATIANMAPEYGATCGIFPVDEVALGYLRFTGRAEQAALAEAYLKEQGLFHTAASPEAEYSDTLELDLATVEPSLAGPRRPQDRVLLGDLKESFLGELERMTARSSGGSSAVATAAGGEGGVAVAEAPAVTEVRTSMAGEEITLRHGSIVIAAITSCTNTSNPSVMLAAGLVARKAVERGLKMPVWVKTSLAPGSKVVTRYLDHADLSQYLDRLGFHLVGYGCTTCIGNSGPLPPPVQEAVRDADLVAVSVLSGNRNFEGRIGPDIRANYLASPPLVVAYGLAGRIDINLYEEPLGTGSDGRPVFLRDLWPTQEEIRQLVDQAVRSEMFTEEYADVYAGDEQWQALEIPHGDTFAWDDASTYVRLPPYFENMPAEPEAVEDIRGARVLALVGDSITTDHISPAGSFSADSPAGEYLIAHGVSPRDFNSYGSRRGNHEVMMRGTFANVRFRNRLVPDLEGGFSLHIPSGRSMSIFAAAERYRGEGTPLIVLAGKEYGTGSSRDWAAKGPRLLGVRAVIAESYERIHRSNLIGMGILPLEFLAGESATGLGLTGLEEYEITGLGAVLDEFASDRQVAVTARDADGGSVAFQARVRLDTPQEDLYLLNGGILQFVLRQLLAE